MTCSTAIKRLRVFTQAEARRWRGRPSPATPEQVIRDTVAEVLPERLKHEIDRLWAKKGRGGGEG